VGHVADYDAPLAGGAEVDDVGAGRGHADQAQAGELRQYLCIEHRLVGDHHLGCARSLDDLARLRIGVDYDAAERFQGVEVQVTRVGSTGVEKYDLHALSVVLFQNAFKPVSSLPNTSVWISCVPS